MKRTILCFLVVVSLTSVCAQAQTRLRVILDQDARGPATTDQQSMLMVLQSPEIETLGITIVSGDQWRDEEVAHTLRMLELTGHPDIRVYPGAVFPLINSKEEIQRWQKLYGVVSYQGAWNEQKSALPPALRLRARGTPASIGNPSRFPIRCRKEIPRLSRRAKTRRTS